MKEPKFTLSIQVSYEEYLGLLWSIDGIHSSNEHLPQKQTVRKIKKFYREFDAKHDAWRAKQFKCARGSSQ